MIIGPYDTLDEAEVVAEKMKQRRANDPDAGTFEVRIQTRS